MANIVANVIVVGVMALLLCLGGWSVWNEHKNGGEQQVTQRRNEIMNIVLMLIFVIEALIGFASCAYIIVTLFTTLGNKFYRKAKYGISLYD